MAGEQQLQQRTLQTQSSAYDEEEEELELQLEVKKMAEAILHYRTTLPDRLNKTFGSLITTQRPFLPPPPPSQMTTESGTTSDGDQNPDVGDADQLKLLSEVALPEEEEEEEEDPETAEKIRLLKLKISSNISATPIILERMKEAISRIDKLELQKGGLELFATTTELIMSLDSHLQQLGLGGELNPSLQAGIETTETLGLEFQ